MKYRPITVKLNNDRITFQVEVDVVGDKATIRDPLNEYALLAEVSGIAGYTQRTLDLVLRRTARVIVSNRTLKERMERDGIRLVG